MSSDFLAAEDFPTRDTKRPATSSSASSSAHSDLSPSSSVALDCHNKTTIVEVVPAVTSPRKGGDGKKKKFSTIVIPAARPDDPSESPSERIRLGICAMDKKARSKPMAEILSRLDDKLFHVVFFGDHMIQNEPVEAWPICDVLIAFYSTGALHFSHKNVNDSFEAITFSKICFPVELSLILLNRVSTG
jgi:Diphosphoinositol pentakisphosphate kinase 2 N-terminal domain